jgi:iron(III) transport system substrate-binding protein
LVLESSLPPGLQGGKWFAFARQARVIVYDKTKNKTIPGGVSSYEALASPIYQGTLCLSLASLNQSLVTSLLSVHGEKKTAAWIKDLLDNTARDPIGGDEDQLKDLLAEKCSLALVGDDAVRRLPADQQAKIGILYPNTSDRGTHITIRGAGVINHAAHREEAIKLVEFLVSRTVQDRLANENKDYRAVDVLKTPNQKGVDSFPFRADSILQKELGPYTPKALHLMEKAGW